MSSKTILLGLSIFRCGSERWVHGRPSWELAPYDRESERTKDFTAWCRDASTECCFNERAGECGVVRFTSQFFVLDKSKSIPIRIGGQTAWEAVRNDFIENKEKIASKDYELHGRCVLDAVPEPTEPEDGNESGHHVRLPHTGIYAIRGRSNIFSLFISSEMKHNDIFGTEYAVVDESSFIFARAGEGALTSCKKSDIFCEMDKGAERLCDGRLELAEETFCEILSDCRGERDMESDEIGENHDIPPDSEEEGDFTGLTNIWSRRRPVHPPR